MTERVRSLRPRVASSDLDRTSAAWIDGLTGTGPERESTVERLHTLLLRIARSEANRRSGLNGITGRELDDVAHQAAADATMSVLRRVEEFRGDSMFTTWAYKFVMLEISSKFGRHVWRREGVRLDDEGWDRLPARLGAGPEDVAASAELAGAVREGVEAALTSHQRRVFVAIVLRAYPLDALVVELGSNRNAIYKTLFDARRKLRTYLVTQGYLETGGRRTT